MMALALESSVPSTFVTAMGTAMAAIFDSGTGPPWKKPAAVCAVFAGRREKGGGAEYLAEYHADYNAGHGPLRTFRRAQQKESQHRRILTNISISP
jgi:hypothetical protein